MSLATHSNKNGAMLRRSIDRFWLKVIVPEDRRQCFEWTGYRDKDGYGRHRPGTGKNYVGAHRFAWQLAGGEIPKGLHVLHRCDNRPCVNPHHLLVGTPKDNAQDMMVRGRFRNAHMLQTHCIHGHEFTPENTRNTKRGHRQCKTCQRIIDRRRTALGLH